MKRVTGGCGKTTVRVMQVSALVLSPYVWDVRFLANHHVFACSFRRALERRRRKNTKKTRKRATKITVIAAIAPVEICPFSAPESVVVLSVPVERDPPALRVLDRAVL